VGLYYVSAVSTLVTVIILRYARIPSPTSFEHEAGFPWTARPLEIITPSDLFGYPLHTEHLSEKHGKDLNDTRPIHPIV
jgi:hypothetical protein